MQDFKVGDVVDMMYGTGEHHQDRVRGAVDRVDTFRGRGQLVVDGSWGFADNAVLVRPAAFLPGDRVSYPAIGLEGGTVERFEPGRSLGEVLVRWDDYGDEVLGAIAKELVLLSRPELTTDETPKLAKLFSEPSPFSEATARALVGPKPEPAEGPVYTAPFEAKGCSVLDAQGVTALHVAARDEGTWDDRRNFAQYVANALNASVFTED